MRALQPFPRLPPPAPEGPRPRRLQGQPHQPAQPHRWVRSPPKKYAYRGICLPRCVCSTCVHPGVSELTVYCSVWCGRRGVEPCVWGAAVLFAAPPQGRQGGRRQGRDDAIRVSLPHEQRSEEKSARVICVPPCPVPSRRVCVGRDDIPLTLWMRIRNEMGTRSLWLDGWMFYCAAVRWSCVAGAWGQRTTTVTPVTPS